MTKKYELESALIGRIARERPSYEHCWKLDEKEGEIVAAYLDEARQVAILVRATNDTVAQMWASHVLVGEREVAA